MKLLVADKDPGHLDLSTYAFRQEGFNVVVAADGAVALERWREEAPDLILLDLSLPRVGGLEVLRRIREHNSASGNTPVIVVSERSSEEDVVSGFAAGADDYVVKPFSHRQLSARIRAVLRRQGSAPESDLEIRAAGLVLDCQAHEVWREEIPNERLHLTPTEFRLLRVLMENVGRVVTAQRLVECAWGYGEGDATMLKTHICHLRVKLGLRSKGAPAQIVALPTVGYSLKAR
jgi:DNA-binding response OmpR family regulator